MEWIDKSVLIAEDEDANFMLLVEYLEPTGIQIIRACNGLEVLEIIKEKRPDIILMDMKMPKMSGNDAAKKIRELNISVPIIAQTAYAYLADKEKMIESGCNDYIAKPIEEDALIEILKKHIS